MLRKSESWFTRGILILLATTFVLGFGFSISKFSGLDGGRGVPQGVAAEVNGEKIALLDFYKARDRIYRQYREQGEIPEWALSFIARGALDQLINLKLMAQKARELGFRVTDEELSEAIRSNPAFQVDGRFIGVEAYRSYVERALNESVGEFESGYREELLAQKLLNFIDETAKITDEELFNLYRTQNERANLYFIVFSSEDFMDSFSPSEEEIKGYYEEHRGEFKTPELRSIRYVALNPEDLKRRVSVSEEEVRAYYDTYPNEFRSSDGEGIRPFSDVKDEIREKMQKRKEDAIRGELLKSLGGLIKKEPLDVIARENGVENVREGGPFSADEKLNDIPSQIVGRAFSIGKGEKTFSQVGDTVWIFEVTNVIPPHEEDFKEAREEVIKRIKSIKARESARVKAEEVLNRARTSGEELGEVARSLGLKLEETGYFSRLEGVPKIDSDDLRIDAFLLDKEDPLASKIYSANDRFYVVSLKDKQGVDLKGFEEKKAELKEKELSRLRREFYTDWIQKLRRESKIVVNESLFSPKG